MPGGRQGAVPTPGPPGHAASRALRIWRDDHRTPWAAPGHRSECIHRPTAVLPGRRCRRLPGTVYGITRDTSPRERMTRQAAWLAAHRDYTVLDSGDC